PPKKRKKSNDEIASQSASSGKLPRKGKSVSCGKCGNVGHNREGCRGQGDGSSQVGVRKVSGQAVGATNVSGQAASVRNVSGQAAGATNVSGQAAGATNVSGQAAGARRSLVKLLVQGRSLVQPLMQKRPQVNPVQHKAQQNKDQGKMSSSSMEILKETTEEVESSKKNKGKQPKTRKKRSPVWNDLEQQMLKKGELPEDVKSMCLHCDELYLCHTRKYGITKLKNHPGRCTPYLEKK
nr:transposase, mutator type [Tanacetum cinerariifolium]